MSEQRDDTVADQAAIRADPQDRAGEQDGAAPTGSVEPIVETGSAELTRLRLRRAPRYRPFGFTGAFIGVIAGIVLALSFTAASNYTMQTIAGYFAAIFGLIGALLGLGLAVLIERRQVRRDPADRA